MDIVGIREAQKFFFDRQRVLDQVDRKVAASFARFGALTMRVARRSMKDAWYRTVKGQKVLRKKELVSKPGSPPLSRLGLLKDFTLFVYDPRQKSVVIGPVKLNRRSTAPKTLEFGGTAAVGRSGKTVKIEARPYMRPAFRVAIDRYPAMLQYGSNA